MLFLVLLIFSSCSSQYFKPAQKTKVASYQIIWTKNLDPAYESGNLPIGINAPTISDHMVYLGTLSGHMIAYRLDRGSVNWKADEKKILGAKAARYGEQIIYGSFFGRVFSRNFLTGELKYAIDLGAPIESRPLIHQDRAIFHLRNHQVVCMDASTGKLLWSYKRSVPLTTTLQGASVPVAKDSSIYVGFADGFVASLSLEEGIVQWEQKISIGQKFIDVDASPLLIEDKLIIGASSGRLKYLDRLNGLTVHEVEATIAHTPVFWNNKIYVGTVNGEILVLSLSGQILQRRFLSERGMSSLKVWNNSLLTAAHDGRIRLLNPENLQTLQEFSLGSPQSTVFGEIAVSDEYAAIYSSRNRLYVLRASNLRM